MLELSGNTPWTALAHNEVRRYTAKLHAGGLDPRSIARKLSSWRGFFNWLSGETALDANPVDGIRAPKRAKTLPKALSVDDAVRLVAPAQHQQGAPSRSNCATAPCSNCCIRAACASPN